MTDRRQPAGTGRRPGGRSARVRAVVLRAAMDALLERGYEGIELPDVARRAGVHPTTLYRRWQTKARLIGEAILEHDQPLLPTPDSGALRTDLEQLLVQGASLLGTPQLRALIRVLAADEADPTGAVAAARARFWPVRVEAAGHIVERAIARGELPPGTDPAAVAELLVGPVILRSLMTARPISPAEARAMVSRVIVAFTAPAATTPSGGG